MRATNLLLVAVLGLGAVSCSTTPPSTTCSAANCGGCCDPTTNKCMAGVELTACGRGGQSCVSCPFNYSCVLGSCSQGNVVGGGNGSSGGTATSGGPTGGGSAGGVMGGGSAGATAGGTAGGAGGGLAGGSTSGGNAAGGMVISCTTGCVSPPAARCSNANTLVTPQANGTCINAQCVFSETQTACPHGCVNNACALPSNCTANARRCNGNQIQTCNSTGSAWLFAQTCTGTCTNGLCDAPCTPNTRRCNGNDVQTCNSAGSTWMSMMSCAQGCLNGSCLTDVLDVNGNMVTMDGEHRFSQRVTVRNGGRIQVTTGRKLTIYAPVIEVEVSSFISGSGQSGPCEAPPDDVAQGIRLVANQVTVSGTISWSGSCSEGGVVIRGGTIDGSGTVTSTAKSLLLYGAGGVAPGLIASGATRSLMPPEVITSSNYPEGGTYNDDGPPPVFTWSKPAQNITGYYYLTGSSSDTPVATSSFLAVEALALREAPEQGSTYLDVVSIDNTGTIGTVPHEFVIKIVSAPPSLGSPTNPTQGMYSVNPTVVMTWDGGNPGVGYYRIFDRYPTTRPTAATGTFEATNKSPAQVLLQNVSDGRWWFHMVALDSMGYSTKSAAHYEIDIGIEPDAGTIAGKVTDPTDAGIVGATVVVQRGLFVTTTTAGGVYTFSGQIPAGSYEVVAKDERPDAGRLQARAAMVTVLPATTTEVNFPLVAGSGCPSCTDVCSGVACGANVCPATGSSGTCVAGECVDVGIRTLNLGLNRGSTSGRDDTHFLSVGYGSGRPDETLVFTAPTSASYSFEFASPTTHTMYPSRAPPCDRIVYRDNAIGYTYGDGTLRAYLTQGQQIFLIVDAISTPGPFTITVR